MDYDAPKLFVGITAGSFDLCHAGHILMLKESRANCDWLIVGLHEDPSVERPEKNKPILSVDERCTILRGIKYIDEIFLYKTEQELYDRLCKEMKQPKNSYSNRLIRFIGDDWRGKNFTGYQLPIPVFFNSREHSLSSSELRERVWKTENSKRKNK